MAMDGMLLIISLLNQKSNILFPLIRRNVFTWSVFLGKAWTPSNPIPCCTGWKLCTLPRQSSVPNFQAVKIGRRTSEKTSRIRFVFLQHVFFYYTFAKLFCLSGKEWLQRLPTSVVHLGLHPNIFIIYTLTINNFHSVSSFIFPYLHTRSLLYKRSGQIYIW